MISVRLFFPRCARSQAREGLTPRAQVMSSTTSSSVIRRTMVSSSSASSSKSKRKRKSHASSNDKLSTPHPRATKKPQRQKAVPPMLLAPTGSPSVYISRSAFAGGFDEEQEDPPMDPSQLFTEQQSSVTPRLFRQAQFEYLSPKMLNHHPPQHGASEVFVLGRSNVGKSSLLNAIMGRKLAITSKSPGRTQQPYYYGLFDSATSAKKDPLQPSDSIAYLVDLPGYGYAQGPKASVERWQATTQELLLDRMEYGVLQRLLLLIDSRRGIQDVDRHVLQWLDEASQIPYSIVLTKADQVDIRQQLKQVNELCLRHASLVSLEHDVAMSPLVHVTSSSKRQGITELQWMLQAEFLNEN